MVEPIKLSCNHRFCIPCLNAAFRKQPADSNQKKCPMCRAVQTQINFTADDLDREKQTQLRESFNEEFLDRQQKLRKAGMLGCEVEVVSLQIGNSFNVKKDEWIAQVKIAEHCKHKYALDKIVLGASFHFTSFEEKKKAWRLSFNKKQESYQFDPDTIDDEHDEFDEESPAYMKAIIAEGVKNPQDRLLKHRQRLCFDKGGFWKYYEIAFDREWLEKTGALRTQVQSEEIEKKKAPEKKESVMKPGTTTNRPKKQPAKALEKK